MSLNKVMLIGNVGRDPEFKSTSNGTALVNMPIATTEKWKDKQGMQQEKTEWHRVVFLRRLADIAGKYLKKGSQIYVEGEMHTKQWERDGQKHYSTEIIASELEILANKAP